MSYRCPRCRCWRLPGECRGCAYWMRRAQEQRTGRRCHHCYTLLPEPERHGRCAGCREARQGADWAYRGQLAAVRFPAEIRTQLLERLTAGESLSAACQGLGVTSQRVHGYRRYAKEWSAALDAALMAGRDPGLAHGTLQAYRHGRCRCPECREIKAARRLIEEPEPAG